MEPSKSQSTQHCHHCGGALTEETTGGLCPRCLLEMNFASNTMPGGESSPHLPPPSPEEMADKFPQFEILECLGRGGMGIVYKARQKTLDRMVAIKVLAGERRDDPQFEQRFSREARTLAKLSHPNIVTVHDFGESHGMFYLVMEFVDGVNLRDVLSDGRMEPAQALTIVPAICEALQFAHEHGVVHRDIKPENILMDRDGRVKIADFGIATLVGARGERSGTPPYMAPEQGEPSSEIDHRSDIYALGVVFYEMLTGERPEQDPSRPSRQVEIDVRLDEVVLRALEKEPAKRYQSAGEFRTVVETVTARGDSDTRPVSQADPAVDRPRPKRGLFAPLLVVHGGKRVIHWPGVLKDSLLLLVIAGIASLPGAFFLMLANVPHVLPRVGGWVVGILITLLGFGFYRAFKTPIEQLQHAGNGSRKVDASRPQAAGADRSRPPHGAWGRPGVDRRSKRTLFGLPLWHVATGMDPVTGRPRTARGIIAIGDRAVGVVALGGFAMGGFAGGGVSIGLVSWGGFAIGLLAMGGVGIGLLAAFAGLALAPIALGGMACGWYAYGGQGFGAHLATATARNAEGIRFFGSWAVPLMIRLSILNVLLIPVFLGLCNLLPLWLRFKGKGSPADELSAGEQTMKKGRWMLVPVFGVLALTALLFWLQRPQRIDERNIAATSPDGMYSATGQTWHAMRIFNKDRTFYRFIVRGAAGAVLEKWEVEVPREKPGTGDVLPPADEILFGQHGRILWSDNSRWASFQVKGAEVAGFDADAGKPTDPSQALNTPEQVARQQMEAIYSGDADRALSLLGPPWSETREDIKEAIWRLQVQGRTKKEVPEFHEWYRDGRYAVTRWEYPPEENGVDHTPYHRKPYLVLERFAGTWRVVWGNDIRAEASLSEILRCFERFRLVSREDPKAVAQAFIAAFGKRDIDFTEMLSAPPLSYRRDKLTRAIAKAGQAQEASGRKPASPSPIGWHQEDPYAVTRTRMLPGEPEIETYLVLKRTGKIWRVVGANISSPDASLAENLKHYKQETMVGRVTVEDLALRFLVAIREKDEETLRELCVDRIKGWTDALVGPFSLELRERFRQSTGEDFALYPGGIRIDLKRKERDLAVVQCLAARELQAKLNDDTLVLFFCRVGTEWKVWTARKAPKSQSLDEHLEQARKWAAEWDNPKTGNAAETTPEQVARAFMDAVLTRDADTVMTLSAPNFRVMVGNNASGWLAEAASTLNKAYARDLSQITHFTEWLHEGDWAVARIASPPDDPERGLYVALFRTEDGWRVSSIDDATVSRPLSECLERARRLPNPRKKAAELAAALAAKQNAERTPAAVKPLAFAPVVETENHMEQTIDAFLESCTAEKILSNEQMFEALKMKNFIAQYGNGQSAMKKHHDKLPPVMRFAISKTSGEPSPKFIEYLQSAHVSVGSRQQTQARLLLQTLGIPPQDAKE